MCLLNRFKSILIHYNEFSKPVMNAHLQQEHFILLVPVAVQFQGRNSLKITLIFTVSEKSLEQRESNRATF